MRLAPLLAVLALAASTSSAADFNAAQIPWRSLGAGLAEARATCKPVYLLVHTEWCSDCKVFSRVFQSPKVVAKAEDFVFVLVDQDRAPEIAARYAPDGEYIPRSMILDPEGRLQADLVALTGRYRHFLGTGSALPLLVYLAAASEKMAGRACPSTGAKFLRPT